MIRPIRSNSSGPSSKNQSLGSSATPSSDSQWVRTTCCMACSSLLGRVDEGGCERSELVEHGAPALVEAGVGMERSVGLGAMHRDRGAPGPVGFGLQGHLGGEERV